jgi:transposase, IS5 family
MGIWAGLGKLCITPKVSEQIASCSYKIHSMKQASLSLDLHCKKTRKREFLEEMGQVVPWAELVSLIAPYYPEGRNGRPPFALESMPRTHFLQQWFTLSDPAMEEAFFDVPLYREFAQLDAQGRLPDESTILRFRHRLEEHKLAEQILATANALLVSKGLLLKVGTAVDATLIAAPTSTKNKDKARDPEMHSSKKGNQWYFGMKAHIGVDADSGLVHTVKGTAGHVHDITEGHSLLHGQEKVVDAGYLGVDKRADAKHEVQWHVAMRPGKRKALDKSHAADAMLDEAEKLKAGVGAKVEHPFRVIKRHFGYLKVRYRGLKKNTQQLVVLFALSNLRMVRSKLMQLQGVGG